MQMQLKSLQELKFIYQFIGKNLLLDSNIDILVSCKRLEVF